MDLYPAFTLINDWYIICEKYSLSLQVLRDPDMIQLYSHHEKLVAIDQHIAFMGGIDLCFGRWDTKQHRCFSHMSMAYLV